MNTAPLDRLICTSPRATGGFPCIFPSPGVRFHYSRAPTFGIFLTRAPRDRCIQNPVFTVSRNRSRGAFFGVIE